MSTISPKILLLFTIYKKGSRFSQLVFIYFFFSRLLDFRWSFLSFLIFVKIFFYSYSCRLPFLFEIPVKILIILSFKFQEKVSVAPVSNCNVSPLRRSGGHQITVNPNFFLLFLNLCFLLLLFSNYAGYGRCGTWY